MANLGRNEEAKTCATDFSQAFAKVPDTRMLFNNKSRDILKIAQEMMRGEIYFKSGEEAKGLLHLRQAVELDDSLAYEEPWGWPQPTRHALGALLMEAGEYSEAELVYRADLGLDGTLPRPSQHPRNIWSLQGLHECLQWRKDSSESSHIKLLLNQARARADIEIRASCLCRSN